MWGFNLIISENQTRELTQICQLIFAFMYGDELQHVTGGGARGRVITALTPPPQHIPEAQ